MLCYDTCQLLQGLAITSPLSFNLHLETWSHRTCLQALTHVHSFLWPRRPQGAGKDWRDSSLAGGAGRTVNWGRSPDAMGKQARLQARAGGGCGTTRER